MVLASGNLEQLPNVAFALTDVHVQDVRQGHDEEPRAHLPSHCSRDERPARGVSACRGAKVPTNLASSRLRTSPSRSAELLTFGASSPPAVPLSLEVAALPRR